MNKTNKRTIHTSRALKVQESVAEIDNITVKQLCAINKRPVVIEQINPEPQYTTNFNTLITSGNPAIAQAIESIMAVGIATMQMAQPPLQVVESIQHPR